MNYLNIITTFLLLSVSAFGFAYQQANEQDLEHIQILGDRSMSFYRKQLKEAQQAFFEQYNIVASEEDFKIACELRKRSFSNLQKQVCEPKFVSTLAYEANQAAFDAGSRRDVDAMLQRLPTEGEKRIAVMKRRKQQLEDMAQQIQANPALLAAYQKMLAAKSNLEKVKER